MSSVSRYPSNSIRDKERRQSSEPRKHIVQDSVVTGKTEIRKKGIVESKIEKWLPGLANAESLGDMAGPIILKGMYDICKNVLDMTFYPDGSPSNSKGHTAYGSHFKKSAASNPTMNGGRRYRKKSVYDFDGIIYDDRGDAELAYYRLGEILDDQDFCSVADLYNVSNLVPESIDWNYGWDDISDAQIVRLRDGSGRYRIDMPDPIQLP